MATLKIHGTEYFYEDQGPKDAPVIVLSPPLYTNTNVYEPVQRVLIDDYRVITYDHRGAGQSERPANADLAESARDVAFLIEKLRVGPVHFVGNCLGSFVGLNLAIQRSDLLKSCTLMGASAEADNEEAMRDMDEFIKNAKKNGMKASIGAFSDLWFGRTFRQTRDPIQVARREKWLHFVAELDAEDLDLAFQIFHRKDISKELSKIHCPVLILSGDENSPASLESYRRLAKGIPGAETKTIHHAGYALAIEQPEEVAEAVSAFVAKVERRLRSHSRRPAASSFELGIYE